MVKAQLENYSPSCKNVWSLININTFKTPVKQSILGTVPNPAGVLCNTEYMFPCYDSKKTEKFWMLKQN